MQLFISLQAIFNKAVDKLKATKNSSKR